MGDPYETSFFYLIWFLACFGGWEAHADTYAGRFDAGSVEIPLRVADELIESIVLGAPVRRIDHSEDGVVVQSDAGVVRAEAVVLALEPGQCSRIEFVPALPAARDRIQTRWLGGHGIKIFVVYETPFWRGDGLAGVASGLDPFPLAIDLSPNDGSEGIMCAVFFGRGGAVGEYSERLQDEASVRALTLDALEAYFGPEARDAKEFHVCSWEGDHWSDGCGSQLPPGVLSTVGSALRAPLGPLIWAGAVTGTMDFMEGAVTSGERAASEAQALLARLEVHTFETKARKR
jgi:monoamine oxidase